MKNLSEMRRIYLPLLAIALVSLLSVAFPLGQPAAVYAATTAALYPGTVTTTAAAPYNGIDWLTPANVGADDTAYAEITDKNFDSGIYSYRLDATNFGFTIPDGATIDGIVVEFERSGAKTDDALVQLIVGGIPSGNNNSVGATWPVGDTIVTFGSSTDLWGLTLTAADIMAITFGVAVAAIGNSNNAIPQIDFLRITVHYTPPPTVTGITPGKGTTADTALSITDLAGTGFIAGASVELNFNSADGIAATSVNVVSDTQITCTFDLSGVTNNLGAAWDVKVTNTDAQSGTGDNLFTIYRPDPTVTSITPNTGEDTGSVSITDLAGTNFVNGSTAVKLAKGGEGDINGTSLVVVATKITCDFDITGAAAGAWDVVVTVTGAESSATLAAGFEVTTSAPSISNDPNNWAIGTVSASTDYWSSDSAPTFPLEDGECHFTVTNDGSPAINISIKATDFSGGDGWTLVASSPGSGEVVLKVGKSGDATEGDMITLTNSGQSFISNLTASATKKWELKLETGTFTDGGLKTSIVTLTATAA
ncbi:hypothetical protein ES708_07414 [subsurface metagenome]